MFGFALQQEEKPALAAASAVHIALIAGLAYWGAREVTALIEQPQEQRMVVNIATDIGLESTAPDAVPEARASTAPTLSETPGAPQPAAENPAPPVPDSPPLPPRPEVQRPEPRPEVQRPEPTPKPKPKPKPKPATKPKPAAKKPAAKPAAKPKKSRSSASSAKKNSASKPRQSSSAGSGSAKPASSSAAKPSGGASRIGSDFLAGSGNSATSNATGNPAATIGPKERSSLLGAITRQLRPHWDAPDGADAEKLVTRVSWRLNKDGSLNGSPQCKPTQGVTDANRPQAKLHCERAIRAIRLAAPFNLPEQYYAGWSRISNFSFKGTL